MTSFSKDNTFEESIQTMSSSGDSHQEENVQESIIGSKSDKRGVLDQPGRFSRSLFSHDLSFDKIGKISFEVRVTDHVQELPRILDRASRQT